MARRQKILPMAGYEESFLSRTLGRFVRGWSLRRAKIAFLASTPIYIGVVLYTHLFEWPVTLAEAVSFVTGASVLTAIVAFFSKRLPEFEFD